MWRFASAVREDLLVGAPGARQGISRDGERNARRTLADLEDNRDL
jgi:hypothetical protein